MRRIGWIGWSVLIVFLSVCALAADDPTIDGSSTSVDAIRKSPDQFINEIVTIEGTATQLLSGDPGTTVFYLLRDDFGMPIKVRSSRGAPEVGSRYRIRGPIGIDTADRDDLFISEEVREPLVASLAAETPPAATPPLLENRGIRMLGLAAAFVVSLLAVMLVLLRRSGKRAERIQPSPTSGQTVPLTPPPKPEIINGKTIKLQSPPQGTLKILPGRLEVPTDKEIKEIRFYRAPSQSTPEVTFGRAPGPAFTHVELKPMTVSSRQAKLNYRDNRWVLTNFAPDTSNPTKYNGQELAVDASTTLEDQDRIEMGEIQFVFREA